MHRDIVWEWADRPGLEHLSLDVAPDAVTADGIVVVALEGRPVRLRYSVRCDARWGFREASLAVDHDGAQSSLALTRNENGQWRVDGSKRTDLDGCTDIDIMTTPFTNTLPIRRQGEPPDRQRVGERRRHDVDVGAAVEIRALAAIDAPLTIFVARQRQAALRAVVVDGERRLAEPPARVAAHGIAQPHRASLESDENHAIGRDPIGRDVERKMLQPRPIGPFPDDVAMHGAKYSSFRAYVGIGTS